MKFFGFNESIFDMLLLPTVVNELFLAIWLIAKGFNLKKQCDK